jgi:large subunit ribosomal protein L21
LTFLKHCIQADQSKEAIEMYAVVASGGKQYKVREGETVRLERLAGEVGSTVSFEKVLLYSDGDTLTVGQPVLENVTVTGRIVRQDKARKVLVFKYKRRKRYRRKNGHRQQFTAVTIDSIQA